MPKEIAARFDFTTDIPMVSQPLSEPVAISGSPIGMPVFRTHLCDFAYNLARRNKLTELFGRNIAHAARESTGFHPTAVL